MRLIESLATPRLVLRPPLAEDAETVNEAICETFQALHEWMPWAKDRPSVEDTREFCLEGREAWESDGACPYLMFDAGTGRFVGASGFATIDWIVPAFEIGYWCRASAQGHGFVTEAVRGLAGYVFTSLGARRATLLIDDRNWPSRRVAERLGFDLEGVLRNDRLDNRGAVRSTCVYALVDPSRLRQEADS